MACYLCIPHLSIRIMNVYDEPLVLKSFMNPKGSKKMRELFVHIKVADDYYGCHFNCRETIGGMPKLHIWSEFDWKTHCNFTVQQIADIEDPEKEVYPITDQEYSPNLIKHMKEIMVE